MPFLYSRLPTMGGTNNVSARRKLQRRCTSKLRVTIMLIVFLVLITRGTIVLYPYRTIKRIYLVLTILSGRNYHKMDQIWYPVQELLPSNNPYSLSPSNKNLSYELPRRFRHTNKNGTQFINTTHFIQQETDTSALLILHNGNVVYERYYGDNNGPGHPTNVQSVSKTIVGTAVGLAYTRGYLDLDRSIGDYVSRFRDAEDGAYHNVSIRRVLQMSTCVDWDESYDGVSWGFFHFHSRLVLQLGLDGFVANMKRKPDCPGNLERFEYAGINTQALVELVREVVPQKSMTKFLQTELWDPLGMEDRAYFCSTRDNTEVGPWGFSASARDLAKIGELYRNSGRSWNGTQILDPDWINNNSNPSDAFLRRGPDKFGYGFQTWLPPSWDDNYTDFAAIGVLNQYIYVSEETVIVKQSTNANNWYPDDIIHFSFFRHIARELRQ